MAKPDEIVMRQAKWRWVIDEYGAVRLLLTSSMARQLGLTRTEPNTRESVKTDQFEEGDQWQLTLS